MVMMWDPKPPTDLEDLDPGWASADWVAQNVQSH